MDGFMRAMAGYLQQKKTDQNDTDRQAGRQAGRHLEHPDIHWTWTRLHSTQQSAINRSIGPLPAAPPARKRPLTANKSAMFVIKPQKAAINE